MTPSDKIAYISEELCIGCGICSKVTIERSTYKLVIMTSSYNMARIAWIESLCWDNSVQLHIVDFKKCPFEAIKIINLPSNLEKDTTHRYSANSFKLHRLVVFS